MVKSTNYEALTMQFSPSSCYFLLGPNVILSTLNLYSFLRVRDQVSHPYKTTGKIIILYISLFMFLNRQLGRQTKWKHACFIY